MFVPKKPTLMLLAFLCTASVLLSCSQEQEFYEEFENKEESTEIEYNESDSSSESAAETENAQSNYDSPHPIAGAYYVTVNGNSSNSEEDE